MKFFREKNVSESRESKSDVYQITITCKYYARIFKNAISLLQKLYRLIGENKNTYKRRNKSTKTESEFFFFLVNSA